MDAPAELRTRLAAALAANQRWMTYTLTNVVEAESFSGHEQAAQTEMRFVLDALGFEVTEIPTDVAAIKASPLYSPVVEELHGCHNLLGRYKASGATGRSLMISGRIPEGAKIFFSLPPDFDVIEKVIEENRKFKETQMPEADALLIYNCGGRLMAFGPLIAEEIRGIAGIWNVPLAGMFSNAEIGRSAEGQVEMHNLTTCWVALKEK